MTPQEAATDIVIHRARTQGLAEAAELAATFAPTSLSDAEKTFFHQEHAAHAMHDFRASLADADSIFLATDPRAAIRVWLRGRDDAGETYAIAAISRAMDAW